MTDVATISTEKIKKWIDEDEDFVLIDVLPEDSYQVRHVPTAISISLKSDDFLEEVAEVADEDETVVVYCASESCQLSPKAAQKLADAGYENVYDYEGGLAGWQEAGYEFESEEVASAKE